MQNEHVSDMEVPFKFREFLLFTKEGIKTRSYCTYSFIRWFFFNWYNQVLNHKYFSVIRNFCELYTIGCIIIIRVVVLKFLRNYVLISCHLECHFCATSENTIWFSLAQIPGLASFSVSFFLSFFFFFWRQLTTSINVSKIWIFVIRLTILSFLEFF